MAFELYCHVFFLVATGFNPNLDPSARVSILSAVNQSGAELVPGGHAQKSSGVEIGCYREIIHDRPPYGLPAI